MKNFYNYIRHLQLINWHICRYSLKALHCSFNGDLFLPSAMHHTEEYYFKKSAENGTLMSNEFSEDDMGAYEYDCCVIYLKNLRTTLFKKGFLNSNYQLEFSEAKNNLTSDLILCPFANCFYTVAKKCGFKVIDECFSENTFIYTLCSDL